MLSALIPSRLSYSAVLLAEQPMHQGSVQHGPLVLVSDLRKFPAPTTDRDRTVSRRSEPSSRATLIGEQPNQMCIRDRSFIASKSLGIPQALLCTFFPEYQHLLLPVSSYFSFFLNRVNERCKPKFTKNSIAVSLRYTRGDAVVTFL